MLHKKTFSLEDYGFYCFDRGSCAEVSTNGEIVLKIYDKKTPKDYRIDSSMFEILKGYNNPHFIELYEIFHKRDIINSWKYKYGKSYTPFAYTTKFYRKENIDVLKASKEYLLENFYEIELLFEEFSKELIAVDDAKNSNVVLTKDNIVIIDPDMFCKFGNKRSIVQVLNKEELLVLFESIVLNGFNIIDKNDYEQKKKLIKSLLTGIKIDDRTQVTYELAKKLRYVSTVGQMF